MIPLFQCRQRQYCPQVNCNNFVWIIFYAIFTLSSSAFVRCFSSVVLASRILLLQATWENLLNFQRQLINMELWRHNTQQKMKGDLIIIILYKFEVLVCVELAVFNCFSNWLCVKLKDKIDWRLTWESKNCNNWVAL